MGIESKDEIDTNAFEETNNGNERKEIKNKCLQGNIATILDQKVGFELIAIFS